ncbi:MAG: alanine--tRNA ligase [Candidatus Marinimicrobia bacterium]|nr:alanine--tRNA ligase [Candidatus Neomarinimicrobiota bacterium]
MTSNEIRQKFLKFFKKKGHELVPSSSLVPTDPSVLLTTAGMQQFKPFYLDKESPFSNKVTSVQKCFRTSDIDEVGGDSHLTFFEMLGNFAFKGEYFKKEAIEYAYEFITKEMELEIDYVSVFEGDNETPADTESEKIWQEIDKNIEIKKFGREDNFWGPTGEEGPCGPTTEIYVNGIEIWNLVFNEYSKNKEGEYIKLEKPGVDTGMGLERLAMVVQKTKNIFETDLFAPILEATNGNRIIADHMRGSVFLVSDGIKPSNLGAGYILRRLIRRAYRHSKMSNIKIAEKVIEIYGEFYPELKTNKEEVIREIIQEEEKFGKTLEKGEKELQRLGEKVSGKEAFVLFSTYGYPVELIEEAGKKIDRQEFEAEMEKHQELSRTASAGMFKGGLVDDNEETTKLHTAAHLLLAALRKVLGSHVEQKGSNITSERLRFDFSHPEKLTDEQKEEIEKLVNEQIGKDLPVTCEEMSPEEAKKDGAVGSFEHKYGDKVKVYAIDNFSKEICGGPHVEKTGVLGKFKIKKEKASSAGVRRIKAVLE